MRFTATTRSQASGATSSSRPQASIPAAVTTASSPPWRSAARSTAASAARPSARSTSSWSKPPGGGFRSSTTGAPPAPATASATAHPSPDAPPVTRTTPRSAGVIHHLLDQPARRAAGQVREHRDPRAPLTQCAGLGKLDAGVVAPLGEHVRAELAQRALRGVLGEDGYGIYARQGGEHRCPVVLGHRRPARSLPPPPRALSSGWTWPAWSRSKQPPVATTVPPRARRRATTSGTEGRSAPGLQAGPATASSRSAPPAPPAATNALATATAWSTASSGGAPSARALTTREAKRSPAPQESPSSAGSAGTASGGGPPPGPPAPPSPRGPPPFSGPPPRELIGLMAAGHEAVDLGQVGGGHHRPWGRRRSPRVGIPHERHLRAGAPKRIAKRRLGRHPPAVVGHQHPVGPADRGPRGRARRLDPRSGPPAV